MTRGSARRRSLPLLPLLAQYLSAPGSGLSGILRVPALDIKELDTSPDEMLANGLEQFAASVLPVNFHPKVFRTRAGFLRHSLTHILRGQDPLPERLSRCITPGEAYHVSGIGWGLWAAV